MIRYDPSVESIPSRNPAETRVLRQLDVWQQEYRQALKASKGTGKYVPPPTTNRLAKHFDVNQDEILQVLSQLERDGLLVKERRLSAGAYGNGYSGSLFSSVLLTANGLRLIRRNTKSGGASA